VKEESFLVSYSEKEVVSTLQASILVVDDENTIRELLYRLLRSKGYHVVTACDGEEALKVLKREQFDLLLSDIRMPGINGIELLEQAIVLAPHLLVIMMTGFGTIELAVNAMKKGAYDFVTKPFMIDEITMVIERGLKELKIKEENIKLKEINQRLIEAEKIKTDLINTISHEFKTPITIIKGYISMMLSGAMGGLKPTVIEGLKDIKQASLKLEHLVTNLITLSLKEKERMVIDRKECVIEDMLTKIITEFREEIEEKNIDFTEYNNLNRRTLFVDAAKLSIALRNLIDNAIKFNNTGGKITLTIDTQEDNLLSIKVCDTGIGFPMDKAESLVVPFTQADMSTTRTYGGTGLGLAVVKAIVESHEGRLSIFSRENVGSEFKITIPGCICR
jgi:signal transduction histidine kinase